MGSHSRQQKSVSTTRKVPSINTASGASTSYFWAIVFFVILAVVSIVNHVSISLVQSTPYMDEEFHVGQTQQYCNGNFRAWDDKITTLPGLYILPAVLARTFGPYFECTTFVLRSVNLVLTFCIYWVFYRLLGLRNLPEKRRAFMAYTLTLFPLNYFFTFLYYTDQLSTFLVLLMSYLVAKNHHALSAVAGALAVFTRQTNVVWVLWIAFLVTWNLLHADLSAWNKKLVEKLSGRGGSAKEKKTTRPHNTKDELRAFDFEHNLIFWSKCVVKISPKIMPYAVLILTFVIFVIVNGGIVVGDRLAHQAALNFPQLFYFALFAGFMYSPLMTLSGPSRTLIQIRKHWVFFLASIAVGLVVVHYNTVVHPYLLADNRHYTFYVWKRFYEWYPISRYLLVPFYIVVWFWICASCQWDPVLFVGFVICLAATVVPQKLLEFRYFIIPFYFLRLNMTNYSEWKHLIFECFFYALLNALTIYQFLMKPYVLEGKTEISRFMW